MTETAPRPASEDEFFSIDRTRAGDTVVVAVAGEIDALSSADLANEIHEALAESAAAVVLDLSSVSFFSSTGLTVLMNAVSEANDLGKPLPVVVGGSSAVSRTVEITGLDRKLDLHETLDEALDPAH